MTTVRSSVFEVSFSFFRSDAPPVRAVAARDGVQPQAPIGCLRVVETGVWARGITIERVLESHGTRARVD